MKTLKLTYWTSTLFVLMGCWILTACTDDDTPRDTTTGGNLLFALTDADANTRTVPADLMVVTDGRLVDEVAQHFVVTITQQDSAYQHRCSATDRDVHLPVGRFALEAVLGNNALVGWDSPYYIGQAEVTIASKSEVQTVEIPCAMQNALVTFDAADYALIQSNTDECVVRVVASLGAEVDSLDWQPGQAEDVYLRAGARVACYLVGRHATSGTSFRIPFGSEVSAAVKATNYHYRVQTGEESGTTTGLTLQVDREDQPTTLQESIPQSYLPAPKITATSSADSEFRFDENDKMEYTETCFGDLVINLEMAHIPTTATLQMSSLGTLKDATYDLLHIDAATREAWEAAGLHYTSSTDLRKQQLDLSTLVSNLQSTEDFGDVTSTLYFTLVANGKTTTRTYAIHTVAPEWSIVMDERCAWSKTLTLGVLTMTRGNADEFYRRMAIDYQPEGSTTWTAASENQRLAREIRWEERPEKTTYRVRATYRNRILFGETSLTLENPAQVPNSDFEEWTDDVYYKNDDKYYSFNPWNEADDCHWDTNNCWSTRHRGNRTTNIARYNGFHTVSYVEGRQGGWAALLQSTGNGRGNRSGGSLRSYNKVAGELFTGSASVTLKNTSGLLADASGEDDIMTRTPAPFSSRPTGVRFWYKYEPYGSDAWKAELILMDENGDEILAKAITSSETATEWTEATLTLDVDDTQLYAKCAKMYLRFYSSDQATGSVPLSGSSVTASFYINQDIDQTATHSDCYLGSKLIIDDVSLVYDR